jgi:5S rRNA maturation endonuclease (ribonuclease M5)
MIKEVSERIERLHRIEKELISLEGEVFRTRDIIFMQADGGQTFALVAGGKKIELPENLNFYEEFYRGYFVRTHRFYLVAFERIEGVFERFPEPEVEFVERRPLRSKDDECDLSLQGTDIRVPVTETYDNALKARLGIEHFTHYSPENEHDRSLRLYGLIDFGWRELAFLDVENKTAVEKFKNKWDIKQFSRDRMLHYFRYFSFNEIDKKRVIKNVLYQTWRWIKKGIEKPIDGNIRSLWYKIKSVLAYHSDVLESGDVYTFYGALLEMVEDEGLFRYKDFGFMDVNEPYRGLGSERPEVILASEKVGHFLFIRDLARKAGVSFLCMKGEPSVLSLEYFSDELAEVVKDKDVSVFCITDVDPAGYSIEGNLVKRLEQNGHKVERLVKLVDIDIFSSDEIKILRYPVVSYRKKGGQIKPVKPSSNSQVTKARDWFCEIDDRRLLSEREGENGWKSVTIWGLESDAADRRKIEERFFGGLQKSLKID